MTSVRWSKTRRTKYFKDWKEAYAFMENLKDDPEFRSVCANSCRPHWYSDGTIRTVFVTYNIKPDDPEEWDD